MKVTNNGYVAGAVLLIPLARKIRDHVEFEKFLCRVLTDNDTTQEFKLKTQSLKNKIYALRYNNIDSEKLTEAGKNAVKQSST